MPANPTRPDVDRFFSFLNNPVGDELKELIKLFSEKGLVPGEERGLIPGALKIMQLSTKAATRVKRPPTILFRDMVKPVTVTGPANDGDGYQIPFTFGELLIDFAWMAGYTPRLYDRPANPASDDGLISVLAFVPFPEPIAASTPVSIDVLRLSARVGPVTTPNGNRPRGLPLRKWIEDIEASYGVQVRAEASMLDQPIVLGFPGAVSLAYVLDAIATYLNATWDWSEDAAILRSRCICSGCDDRLASR